MAFLNTWISFAGYVIVAISWLLPDPRIEKTLKQGPKAAAHSAQSFPG
jgi:hypothetical protein